MEWAIDSSGKHVRAGTPEADSPYLRCPVCKSQVYHKHGIFRRPHFAHKSGNSNKDCELYHPSAGVGTLNVMTATNRLRQVVAAASLKSSALIWRDGEPIPMSLVLRLPILPVGYSSILSIHSNLGQLRFSGEALTKTTFAQVGLQEPPASLRLTPPDPALELQLKAVLEEFRLAGNFFRVTVNGGVLERRDTPLELGNEYFLVTKQQLPLRSCPSSLEVVDKPRNDRTWTVYRLRLRDTPQTRDADIVELGIYLARNIIPARPRIEVVWPPPNRFDPDGTHIYGTNVSQLIVRSNSGHPSCETVDAGSAVVTPFGNDLYGIDFKNLTSEAVVWLPGASIQRLRFEDTPLFDPEGVRLKSGNEVIDLYDQKASEFTQSGGHIEILVPSQRLWRRLRINQRPLRPLPSTHVYEIKDALRDMDAGAFGSIHGPSATVVIGQEWYSQFETMIVSIAGPAALKRLGYTRTKRQLVRWAAENRALSLLPHLLSAFSAEVDHGFS